MKSQCKASPFFAAERSVLSNKSGAYRGSGRLLTVAMGLRLSSAKAMKKMPFVRLICYHPARFRALQGMVSVRVYNNLSGLAGHTSQALKGRKRIGPNAAKSICLHSPHVPPLC